MSRLPQNEFLGFLGGLSVNLSRRRFLGLGAAALCATFIPADRLDWGIPKQKILTLPPLEIDDITACHERGLTMADVLAPYTPAEQRLIDRFTHLKPVLGQSDVIPRSTETYHGIPIHVIERTGDQMSDLFFDTDSIAEPHADALIGMRRRIMGFDEPGGESGIYAVDFGPGTPLPRGSFGFESYFGMQIKQPQSAIRLRGARDDTTPLLGKNNDGKWEQRGMVALKRLDTIQSDVRRRA